MVSLTCWTRTVGPFSRTDCAPDWYWWLLGAIALASLVILAVWAIRQWFDE